MFRVMLDTNVISHVLKRPHSQIAERFRRTPSRDIAISSIVEEELRYGVARLPAAAHLPLLVETALSKLDILPWDSACASRCAAIRAKLATTGIPLSYADVMIAAHALALHLVLVTNDQAFRRMRELSVEDWTLPA